MGTLSRNSLFQNTIHNIAVMRITVVESQFIGDLIAIEGNSITELGFGVSFDSGASSFR